MAIQTLGGVADSAAGEKMYKFMTASFLLLGWAFYEMSGGADFVPEGRDVMAEAETTVDDVLEQVVAESVSEENTLLMQASLIADLPVEESVEVTRADTSDLTSVGEIAESEAPESIWLQPAVEEVDVAATDGDALPALLDLRAVAGSRVNMRSGPGTNHGVLDTLGQGTEAEVLELSSNGWARIRVLETGQIGWMAERLLTPL